MNVGNAEEVDSSTSEVTTGTGPEELDLMTAEEVVVLAPTDVLPARAQLEEDVVEAVD